MVRSERNVLHGKLDKIKWKCLLLWVFERLKNDSFEVFTRIVVDFDHRIEQLELAKAGDRNLTKVEMKNEISLQMLQHQILFYVLNISVFVIILILSVIIVFAIFCNRTKSTKEEEEVEMENVYMPQAEEEEGIYSEIDWF